MGLHGSEYEVTAEIYVLTWGEGGNVSGWWYYVQRVGNNMTGGIM